MTVVLASVVLMIAIAMPATALTGIHLSDLHYDQFFGTAAASKKECRTADTPWYGVAGCDTSKTLMESAIDDAAAQLASTGQMGVVYYTGDWLRHDMTSVPGNVTEVAIATFTDVAKRFAKTWLNGDVHAVAHPAVAVALGNEDFVPDYHFNVSNAGNDPLLAAMAGILVKEGLLKDSEAATFGYCGYTSRVSANRTTAGKRIRVVSLNTLIWTYQVKPAPTTGDPCGQLAWLTSELEAAAAAGEIVHVLSHIFPDVTFWKPQYYEPYRALMRKYNGVVTAQFFGHIHRMSFIVEAPSGANGTAFAPVHIGGPITRASKTNPDFAIMSLDDSTGAVMDRVQRLFNDTAAAWQTGSALRDVLGIQSLSSADLHAAAIRLMNTTSPEANAQFQRFWQLFEGGITTKPCTGLCQKLVMCSTVTLDFDDVFECKILSRRNFLRNLTQDG